jgi:ABC-2 type transport system permease protein
MANKIKLIIEREYMTKVRRKSFIVMTILGPLLFVGVFGIIAFLASVNKDNKTIVVYDETSMFTDTFKDTESTNYEYVPTSGIKEVIEKVKKNEYYGIIHIPFRLNNLDSIAKSVEFLSDETPAISVTSSIENKIKGTIRELKLVELGTSEEVVDKANVNVEMRYVNYNGELKDTEFTSIKIVIGAISGMMIYMFIFIYGVQVMRSVIEEKTNRIIEVIISSVKPFELMMGKIVGSALVGLTQFVLWTILSSIIFSVAKGYFGIGKPSNQVIAEVTPEMTNKMQLLLTSIFEMNFALIVGAFLFFFLGGYLLYSALFAAVGSAVDSETDTQQFMLPITLPLIIAIYSGFMVLENPNGPVAFWLSMIPFTSPIVMMARIPFDVPIWQIVLSMGILIIGFILTTLLASKIYRTGILMYGKKPSYSEIWKWIRHS